MFDVLFLNINNNFEVIRVLLKNLSKLLVLEQVNNNPNSVFEDAYA